VPSGIDRAQVRRDLAPAYQRAERALAPADPEGIVEALKFVAETLHVELPEGDGLMAYVALLQAIPMRALKPGFLKILETFAYPRMPMPAELLTACGGPAHELMFWHQSLKRAIELLDKEDTT
jgi:hypothetical protein